MKINGKQVIDASRRIKITITPTDVAKGYNKDPGACAAARACLRQLQATAVRVHIERTYVEVGNRWVRFKTPSGLRSQIVTFDRGGNFKPGEYILNPLQPSKKTGMRQGSSTKPAVKGKRRAAKRHMTAGVRQWGAAPR